jgi:predicted nucleotidyltransferase
MFNKGYVMGIIEIVSSKRDEILKIAHKYGAFNVRVFGSVARGDADDQSDLDLLVDMQPGRSLLDLGGVWSELNQLMGRKVDIVTEQGLRDRIRGQVLREARSLEK